jgi:hypothetical protein
MRSLYIALLYIGWLIAGFLLSTIIVDIGLALASLINRQ